MSCFGTNPVISHEWKNNGILLKVYVIFHRFCIDTLYIRAVCSHLYLYFAGVVHIIYKSGVFHTRIFIFQDTLYTRACVSHVYPYFAGGVHIINKWNVFHTCIFILQVMTISKYKTLYTILLIFVIVSTGHSYTIQSTLCEARCETATPYLRTLKALWHRMSKRIGRQSEYICNIKPIETSIWGDRLSPTISPRGGKWTHKTSLIRTLFSLKCQY
jgi:hypothetical protein